MNSSYYTDQELQAIHKNALGAPQEKYTFTDAYLKRFYWLSIFAYMMGTVVLILSIVGALLEFFSPPTSPLYVIMPLLYGLIAFSVNTIIGSLTLKAYHAYKNVGIIRCEAGFLYPKPKIMHLALESIHWHDIVFIESSLLNINYKVIYLKHGRMRSVSLHFGIANFDELVKNIQDKVPDRNT